MNLQNGPISDLAGALLSIKQQKELWDRHAQMTGGATGVAGAAPAAIPGSGRAGVGGGGTAPSPDGYWEKYRAESQARRDAAQRASDAEWSGMMGDAARKTAAFNVAGSIDAATSLPRTQFTGMGMPTPRGADGQELPTDQNGGTQAQTSGSQSSSPSSDDEEKKDENQGYDTASNDTGGEPRASGGPVRAGGLYHVAEGDKPELYVQNDGDAYPLTQDMRMRPRESGIIVPNPELAQLGAGPGTPQRVAGPGKFTTADAAVAAGGGGSSQVSLQQPTSSYDAAANPRLAAIRAKSGELDAVPQHYWSQAEKAAMAPILARREAASAAQTETAQGSRSNPYIARLQEVTRDDNTYGANQTVLPNGEILYTKTDSNGRLTRINPTGEVARMRRIAAAGSGYSQVFRDQAQRWLTDRDKGIAELEGRAAAVNQANDPYYKIQREQEKERNTALQGAQREKDEAAGRLASLARSPDGKEQLYQTFGDKGEAMANAVTRGYLQQQFNRAGYQGTASDITTESDESLRRRRDQLARGKGQ